MNKKDILICIGCFFLFLLLVNVISKGNYCIEGYRRRGRKHRKHHKHNKHHKGHGGQGGSSLKDDPPWTPEKSEVDKLKRDCSRGCCAAWADQRYKNPYRHYRDKKPVQDDCVERGSKKLCIASAIEVETNPNWKKWPQWACNWGQSKPHDNADGDWW